jgi:hypothetical protein
MKKTILIAAVMFFALSVSAFAQSAFTIASERPTVACCGLAEPVGAISFTAVPANPADLTAVGTIQIVYTQPITNTGLTLGQYGVQIVTTGGTAATLANVTNIGGQGVVVIGIPAGQPSNYRIRVSNVRVNVSTSCNTPSAVTASASSVGNDLTVSETNDIQVLAGIQQALLTPTVSQAVSVDASNGATTVTGATAIINVQEGFLSAFGLTSATDTTQTSGKVIRLTLSGTLPTGVTLTFPATDNSGLFTRSNAAGTASASTLAVTSIATPVYYVLTANSDPTQQETFGINVIVSAVGPYPLAPGAVAVSAHIGPISTTSYYPRYTEGNCETAATQFLTVSGALTTTLLVPYAVDLGNTQGAYQTGIVVSNTTADPGTAAMGFLQAIRQTGKITVYFYPSNGTSVATWVSTSFPNFGGLDANGKLPPGGQFAAMVNQLFPSTVTSFSGYLFIITDFTNAHGEFFISNFDNFTHGALMLVVNNPLIATTVGRTVSEGLNQ